MTAVSFGHHFRQLKAYFVLNPLDMIWRVLSGREILFSNDIDHYKGIGACPLNWMVGPSTDRKLKKLLNLNDSENVIMMISAGRVPEKVWVAKSVRKNVDEQLTIL